MTQDYQKILTINQIIFNADKCLKICTSPMVQKSAPWTLQCLCGRRSPRAIPLLFPGFGRLYFLTFIHLCKAERLALASEMWSAVIGVTSSRKHSMDTLWSLRLPRPGAPGSGEWFAATSSLTQPRNLNPHSTAAGSCPELQVCLRKIKLL